MNSAHLKLNLLMSVLMISSFNSMSAPHKTKLESLPPFEASKEVKSELSLDSALPTKEKKIEKTSSPTSKASAPSPEIPAGHLKSVEKPVDSRRHAESLETLFRLGQWRDLREELKSRVQAGKSLTSEQRFMGAYANEKLIGQAEAIGEYDRLFQDGYYSGIFYSQYLKALYDLGRYERAKQIASTLISREGRKPELGMTLALIETQLRNYEEALQLLEDVRQEMDSKKEYHQVRVYIGERLKRPEIKLGGLRKLMWIEPENIFHARDFLHELSKSNDSQKFFNEAQKLRTRFPKDPTINRAMARASRAVGKHDLARFYDKEASR